MVPANKVQRIQDWQTKSSIFWNIRYGKESAISSFKLQIKDKFCKSHDLVGYTELILDSNCYK